MSVPDEPTISTCTHSYPLTVPLVSPARCRTAQHWSPYPGASPTHPPCLRHPTIAALPLTATATALYWGATTCATAVAVGVWSASVAAIGGQLKARWRNGSHATTGQLSIWTPGRRTPTSALLPGRSTLSEARLPRPSQRSAAAAATAGSMWISCQR